MPLSGLPQWTTGENVQQLGYASINYLFKHISHWLYRPCIIIKLIVADIGDDYSIIGTVQTVN